jgi:cell division protein FtsZ
MALMDPKSDGLKFEIQEEVPPRPRIRVIGVGGAGTNAVAHIMAGGMEGVEFWAVNTDLQALRASPVPNKLAIGLRVTAGQGAGGDPELGRQAALEDTERLIELLQGASMVFIAAGLGRGTGTGAAPVIAAMARQMDALTAAMVTKPFTLEGPQRTELAEQGLQKLTEAVDALITVANDRLLALAPRGASVLEAFRMAHEIMRRAVQEIVEIIQTPGLINRDFADIRAVMRGGGLAVLGTAVARGENPAVEAARQAINCPLVEGASLAGARNVLVHVTGSSRLGIHELHEACQVVREATRRPDSEVSFGIVLNEAMADAVKVSVIATGFAPVSEAEQAVSDASWRTGSPTQPPPEPLHAEAAMSFAAANPAPAERAEPLYSEPADEVDDLEDLDTPPFLRRRRLVR